MNKVEKGFLSVVMLAILAVLILIFLKDCNCCCETNCVMESIYEIVQVTQVVEVTEEVEVTEIVEITKIVEITPTTTPTPTSTLPGFITPIIPTSIPVTKTPGFNPTPIVPTNIPPTIQPTNVVPTNIPPIPTEEDHCNNGVGNGEDCPVNDQIDNDICGDHPCAKETAKAKH